MSGFTKYVYINYAELPFSILFHRPLKDIPRLLKLFIQIQTLSTRCYKYEIVK